MVMIFKILTTMRIFLYRAFIFIFICCVSLAANGKSYLVSVGISNYPGKQNDLSLGHNDAATMNWLFEKQHDSERVLILNSKATHNTVVAEMKKLFARAKATDRVVFFFSGHGAPGGFCLFDYILTYEEVRNIMAESKCKNKIVFADACFAGGIREGSSATGDYGGIKTSNIMLFLSCRTNETSIERMDRTNGLFTYALQHGLRGNADVNKDKVVTARELFNYVSKEVKKSSFDKQHPVMWGKFNEQMPVMKW